MNGGSYIYCKPSLSSCGTVMLLIPCIFNCIVLVKHPSLTVNVYLCSLALQCIVNTSYLHMHTQCTVMIGTVVNMCNKKGKKQQQSGDQDEPEMANAIINCQLKSTDYGSSLDIAAQLITG